MWDVKDVFGKTHAIDLDNLVLSSDWHLQHVNILRYGRGDRWLTLDAMNHSLLDNIYQAAHGKDLLILGDLVMGNRETGLEMVSHLVEDLDKRPYLVPGNHDYCHPMWTHKWGDKWIQRYTEAGLVILPTELKLILNEQAIDFCHFPYDGDHTDEVRYEKWRPTDKGNWLIHGHLHGTRGQRTGTRQLEVGVDAWDYKPVAFRTLLEMTTT